MTQHASGIDTLLARADPVPEPPDDHLVALAESLAEANRVAVASPRRHLRRRWLWIPVACVAGLSAASGAAAATGVFDGWHVNFTVEGKTIDRDVTPDVSIPLRFVTTDGQHLSCTYSLAYVWGDAQPLRKFLTGHDWRGFGQEAYDEFIAHPYYPTEVTEVDMDGTEHKLSAAEIHAQGPEFEHSIDVVLERTIPPALRDAEVISTGSSDCSTVMQ
jgi:hypothetical protein